MASIPPATALPPPPTTAATTTATTAAPKSNHTKATTTKTKTVIKATGTAATQAKTKKPVSRKKKPTTSTSTSQNVHSNKTNHHALQQQQAKAAQADLVRQKAQAEARRLDPLWYRMEDILIPGDMTSSSATMTTSTVLPEQAQVVEQVLATYGLGPSDVTPQAMTCLLEQSRRFANELISHAQDFAYSANRAEVLDVDLKLAAQLRPDFRHAVTAQIPKLHQLAQHINRAPLPPIPSHSYGVLLPPKPHQLTARTYDVVSGARVQRKMILKVPQAPKSASNSSSTKKKTGVHTTPSYGATKGRPIPIQWKTTTPVVETTTMDVSSPSKATTTVVETTTTMEATTTNDTSLGTNAGAAVVASTTTETSPNVATSGPFVGASEEGVASSRNMTETQMTTAQTDAPNTEMDATRAPLTTTTTTLEANKNTSLPVPMELEATSTTTTKTTEESAAVVETTTAAATSNQEAPSSFSSEMITTIAQMDAMPTNETMTEALVPGERTDANPPTNAPEEDLDAPSMDLNEHNVSTPKTMNDDTL